MTVLSKKQFGKKLFFFGLISLTGLLRGFSSQDDTSSTRPTHALQFFGTIATANGETIKVENISISGLIEGIPVYAIPVAPDVDPATNTTRLRLADTGTITTTYEQNKAIIRTFRGREYVEIQVEFKDKTVKPYIIERSRQIFCYESFDMRPKREFSFEAVKKCIIEGSITRDSCNEAEQKLRKNTEQFLTDIEAQLQQISDEPAKAPLT